MKRLNRLAIAVICCTLSANSFSAQPPNQLGTLVFASDLLRHGARTSIWPLGKAKFPPMWSKANIGPGQLTQYGFYEERQNGQYFREIYSDLFPQPQVANAQICVRSDGSNRDIMSALGVMAGFFPNNPPFVVEAVPMEKDFLLTPPRGSGQAIKYARGWENMWHSALGYHFFKKLEKDNIVHHVCPFKVNPRKYMDCLFPAIHIGSDISTLENYCKHRNSRCNANEIIDLDRVTRKKITTLFNWYNLHNYIYTADPGFKAYLNAYKKVGIKTGASALISEVIHNLLQVMAGKTDKKYVLYTAHDTTILAVVGYLVSQQPKRYAKYLPLRGEPAFASDLSFRLYRNSEGKYTLQVVFRNGYRKDQAIEPVYLGSVKQFEKLYFNSKQLARIAAIRRCDYL